MSKRKIKSCGILVILLLSFLFFAPVGYCSEVTYTITAEQLQALKNHLNELERNNNLLMMLLDEQGTESSEALKALTESRNELSILKEQLTEAKKDADNARKSLQIANKELQNASQSFKQYQTQTERTERRLTIQRDFWAVLSCLLAGGLAVSL